MRSLYTDGLAEYLSDLWNILDFCANLGYMTWITLRLNAFYVVWVSIVGTRGRFEEVPRNIHRCFFRREN